VPLTILASAGGLVAVDKPAGLLVIPGREGGGPCARELLAEQLGTRVWVCHRLDRDTSGVLVLATTAEAHRAASMAFEAGEVRKRYVALVEGRVEHPLDLDVALTGARRGRMRPVYPGEAGKPSRTRVRPRQVFAHASLVECEPLTGRQHQIRVHLKHAGHPLLFDHQYGRKAPVTATHLGGAGDDVVLARTPLHAEALDAPALGLSVTAPLPDDLRRCIELLSAGGRAPRSSGL
jgi:tRNA pseudouridine32 synthase/23S rRNA pseudouridine746 synthase/23S rRNA pseudouridine955/2504/2580 synthase